MQVSVIIPFYNSQNFLAQTVDSVLAQPQCGEIILIDDASTDQSAQLAEKLTEQYKQIRFFRHQINRGPSHSRNTGLNVAIFPLVAFLDADDQYLPNRFTDTVNVFEKNPHIQVVYGPTENHYKTPAIRKRYDTIFSKELEVIYLEKDEQNSDFENLVKGQHGSLHLNAITIRTSYLKRTRFDTDLWIIQDTDFVLQLAQETNFHALDKNNILAIRYLHGSNIVFLQETLIKDRQLFLRKWIFRTLKYRSPINTTLYFLRSYLGEHPLIRNRKLSWLRCKWIKFILVLKLIGSKS